MDIGHADSWRRENVGRLMNIATARFEARVFELLSALDHDEVPIAHLHLTRNLDLGGTRTTELARRAAMTKQAMSEIVAQCEAAGLVYRTPDPRDARAKLVRFSDQGLVWLAAFQQAVQFAESEMQNELGCDDMVSLKLMLTKYANRG